MDIYNEISKEAGGIDKIGQRIVTLKDTSSDNKELYDLLVIDLEDSKKKNNELEARLAYLNNLKEIEKNSTILINKKITYNQFPNYPTGCESVALYILLKYNDIDVQVEDIVKNLKKGDLPYKVENNIYGGNPEIEFIGNPKTKYSYGVYNKPIAEVAAKFKGNVVSKIGLEFNDMLGIVKQGKAVLVWATINMSKPFISTSWIYKPTMEKINWISGEHAMVVIGYNQKQVIVSDPYTGTIRYFDKNIFKSRYDYLGKRAIYY